MRTPSVAILFILTLGLLTEQGPTVRAANWPAWRGGVEGTGMATEKTAPTHWSDKENVRWRIPLPDRGNSTPVIWEDRIFITQAIEKENRRTLMCFSRKDGHLLWQQGVVYAAQESTHEANPYCSASPVTDGERVIVTYGSAGVYCYDLAGKEVWHRDLGPQKHIWGNASSPVISGEACFVYHGPGDGSFLVALDKRTGKDLWKYAVPNLDTSDRTDGFKGKSDGIVGAFSTPIVIPAGGRQELVMSFPKFLQAFDPKTGMELWRCGGLSPLIYTSPLWNNGVVVAMGGYFGDTIAVKAGGQGDVTASRLWQQVRGKGGIGTGVIKDGYIFYLNSSGLVSCLELATGKVVWEERVKGPGAKGDSWSSMTLIGDNIYQPNQSGDVIVLKASPKFEVVSVNSVKEFTNSSIAVSEGELFLRTYQSLWCIADLTVKRTVAR